MGNPRGVWHTIDVHEPGRLLTFTPDLGPNTAPLDGPSFAGAAGNSQDLGMDVPRRGGTISCRKGTTYVGEIWNPR